MLGIQTYQILTNFDEVCIQSLSSILLAVQKLMKFWEILQYHFQNFENQETLTLWASEFKRH